MFKLLTESILADVDSLGFETQSVFAVSFEEDLERDARLRRYLIQKTIDDIEKRALYELLDTDGPHITVILTPTTFSVDEF